MGPACQLQQRLCLVKGLAPRKRYACQEGVSLDALPERINGPHNTAIIRLGLRVMAARAVKLAALGENTKTYARTVNNGIVNGPKQPYGSLARVILS